jgi:hypothetical protein
MKTIRDFFANPKEQTVDAKEAVCAKVDSSTKNQKKNKKRKRPTLPEKSVSIHFGIEDKVHTVMIDGVRSLDDLNITLTGNFQNHSKDTIINFLAGFGRFIQ